MEQFSNAREAKEFLVSQIVEQAQRDGVPLSEVERKMLYFTETAWTLPDIMEVSDEFDRTYDQGEYEEKITRLIQNAAERARQFPGEFDTWMSAIRILEKEDHYILVMIRSAGLQQSRLVMRSAGLRPPHDRLKLLGAGFAVVVVFMCVFALAMWVSERYHIDLGKYVPSKEDSGFFAWAIAASVAVGYAFLRLVVGAKRIDGMIGKLMRRILRVPDGGNR